MARKKAQTERKASAFDAKLSKVFRVVSHRNGLQCDANARNTERASFAQGQESGEGGGQ